MNIPKTNMLLTWRKARQEWSLVPTNKMKKAFQEFASTRVFFLGFSEFLHGVWRDTGHSSIA